ncbi:ROK family protein [Nocardia africana]|uniref:Glucokinase n=1 Tax=Nocardia africana TaxID=134964 RepID=A0A378X5D0_9NOCA|nr:ROK family protein [Nocardia africana]MCC3317603.1 ROK family protein [Nocardia africana]SUA48362.1 Glucokinase [Nocardia africana]
MTEAGELDAVLAMDVGGTTIKAEISDSRGRVAAAATVLTPHGERAFDAMAALGDRLLAEISSDTRAGLRRGAIALPGIVDAARSLAVFSGNIGWRDVLVGNRFRDRWGFPVLIEHDVTLAGWAEWRLGAGCGADDVLVVNLGTGISGALVVAGRLVRGGAGQAGEYGHIPVRRDGRRCSCGNIGCVETVASGPAVARAYRERTGRDIDSAEAVFAALPGDADARAVIDDALDALADGLVGVVHAVCPRRIVIGGGLAGAGPVLIEGLRARLDRLVRVAPVPQVVTGAFGVRAGLVGAARYARLGVLE